MNEAALKLLQQRNACAKLTSPGPDEEQLQEIFKAAVRVPDHAGLKPWFFITIEGDARIKLGELFILAREQNGEVLDAQQQQKIRQQPLRAPLIIAVAANVQEHAKVPDIEQILSAGCAAEHILLAAEALGFGAIWRTGDMAFDDLVQDGLGLEQHQMLIGFLYIGTKDKEDKTVMETDIHQYVRAWGV